MDTRTYPTVSDFKHPLAQGVVDDEVRCGLRQEVEQYSHERAQPAARHQIVPVHAQPYRAYRQAAQYTDRVEKWHYI